MAKLTQKEIEAKRAHHNAVVKAWRLKNAKRFKAYEKAYRAEHSKTNGKGK
jgi:hypothetical protein